jgi:5-methylcytosine-specific restriction endonuclease McrBC regulatory subunit McrC
MYADLVLRHAGRTYVLDTKWKALPPHERPGIEDLRQMYVYNDHYGAMAPATALLIYPTLQSEPHMRTGHYTNGRGHCHLAYWPLPIAQQSPQAPNAADVEVWLRGEGT